MHVVYYIQFYRVWILDKYKTKKKHVLTIVSSAYHSFINRICCFIRKNTG